MSNKLCERKIFISSTIHNLQEERSAVYERLHHPFNCVKFNPISSDRPETLHMSGDDLETRAGYNPNLFILNQVKYADYYMILLNDEYYGEINILDHGAVGKQERVISITHAEFRAAFRHAQPIFAFIDKDTGLLCVDLEKQDYPTDKDILVPYVCTTCGETTWKTK